MTVTDAAVQDFPNDRKWITFTLMSAATAVILLT
jgi:hypothetical protein